MTKCTLCCALYVLQRTTLEDPALGYLQNDTLVIKCTLELVVSTARPDLGDLATPPPLTLGRDMGELLSTGEQQRHAHQTQLMTRTTGSGECGHHNNS